MGSEEPDQSISVERIDYTDRGRQETLGGTVEDKTEWRDGKIRNILRTNTIQRISESRRVAKETTGRTREETTQREQMTIYIGSGKDETGELDILGKTKPE